MIFEKPRMQMAYSLRNVALFDYKTNVEFRSSLRNHSDINAGFCDGIEHACCDSRYTVNILSHQAYDRRLIIAVNFGNFFEVGDQSLWEPFGVHGKRHAHFRNGYDIYRRAVKIESFEYGSQKTMDHNATRSHDVHNADT